VLWKAVTMLLAALALAASAAVARGPWRANESNTSGWQLMSPQERLRYQARIRRSGNYEECMRYEQEHEVAMRERARRGGQALQQNEQDACVSMQTRPARQ